MDYKELIVEIVGACPLLMHNGQLADPMNKHAKAMKEVSDRGKKTDADREEISRIEFFAGLYMDASGPILPARLIEAGITEGAKKSKKGKQAQAGVVVEHHASLIYDGPRTAQELFDDENFRFAVPAKVQRIKVVRTRPIFRGWSATLVISYLEDIINRRDLLTSIRSAGSLCGFGDWRPRYGRFNLAEDLPQRA